MGPRIVANRTKAITDVTILTKKAITVGAKSGSSEMVDVEDISLVYAPINTTRVKLRVAGDLA
ncbi:conserved protein of unknown function [Oenococcus oeni]|uniref:Uncharacterized protein n=1 Tax=Oenococcus oeni TaxID=1247 RepID=A0AAQ2ZFL6_OENOE|nr:hypothetical protein [Oenococcus oeni]SYW05234.1 conserved hypothetical protein [Oenococcus oeni]VDB98809.1 conserved protein of unknown function [Oenococcus oeni]